jgi:4-amino-4-deoxy-L-arabinose transferase-like glycosyltransferase
MHARDTVPLPSRPPAPPAAATLAATPRRWLAVSPLAVLLLGSLAVKLALWARYVVGADPAVLLKDDAGSYHDSARALLETGTFSISPLPPLLPQTLRTPGYPSFLAAVYAVFGERPAAALLVQILLSVATLALVYVLVRALWGGRVALLAAALLALDVPSIRFSLLPLTETLFTLLLVAALGCGVALLTRRDQRRRWALGLGLALAACAFVRPAAYYLVVPVALGVLVHARRSGWGTRESAWTLALLVIPYAAAVGGWQMRNQRVSGSTAFSQLDGTVLLLYRGAAVVARRDGIGFDEAQRRLAAAYAAGPRDPHTTRDNQRWKAAGIELIRENPGIYARVVAAGIVRPLLEPAGLALSRPDPPAPEPGWREESSRLGPWAAARARIARRGALHTASFALDVLLVLVTLLAAAYALARLAAERRFSVVDAFLMGVVLYVLLIHAGATSGVRTRVPLQPVLALYAARGLVELRTRRRTTTHSALA